MLSDPPSACLTRIVGVVYPSTNSPPTDLTVLFGTPSVKLRAANDPRAPRTGRYRVQGKEASGIGAVCETHKKALNTRRAAYVAMRARLDCAQEVEVGDESSDANVQDFNRQHDAPVLSTRMMALLDQSEDLETSEMEVLFSTELNDEVADLEMMMRTTKVFDDGVKANIEVSTRVEGCELEVPINAKLEKEMAGLEKILRAIDDGVKARIEASAMTDDGIKKGRLDFASLTRSLKQEQECSAAADEDAMVDEEQRINETQKAHAERNQHLTLRQSLGGVGSIIIPAPADGHLFGQASQLPTILAAPAQVPHSLAPAPATENEFYDARLSFEQAETKLSAKLQDATSSCRKWADVYAPNHFRAFAREKQQVVLKLCKSLFDVAQLLHVGRQGWNFTHWSTPLFNSTIETLLPELLQCLETLAGYDGCVWMKVEGMIHAQEAQHRLGAIWGQKQTQELQEAAADRAMEKALWDALED
ncbi:hypothetical protein LTR08_007198 [Meristemomyces frigidus]|nr:hypothetical protein LTR08_007198 [Meristemomyces frigidus]